MTRLLLIGETFLPDPLRQVAAITGDLQQEFERIIWMTQRIGRLIDGAAGQLIAVA